MYFHGIRLNSIFEAGHFFALLKFQVYPLLHSLTHSLTHHPLTHTQSVEYQHSRTVLSDTVTLWLSEFVCVCVCVSVSASVRQ